MDDLDSIRQTPSHAAGRRTLSAADVPSIDEPSASASYNEDLLSGTGSIPKIASSTGTISSTQLTDDGGSDIAFSTASAPAAPRYVRQRTPHRSQGTLDDLNAEDSTSSATYTHDSNISVGGATPLSGMAYRRARSDMSRVKSSTSYGQYLEIPKGRRSIFASRERARRRNSVLALFVVVVLLVLAAMFLWNMMQNILG